MTNSTVLGLTSLTTATTLKSATNFKSLLMKDMDVYLNLEEYAAIHQIEEEEVVCIVEGSTVKEDYLTEAKYDGYEGLYGTEKVIHISATSIEEPIEGQVLRLDNELYIVKEVKKEEGLLSIRIGANNGG